MRLEIKLIIFVIYVIYSLIITNKIKRTTILDNKKKNLNIVLVWVIPVIWGLFVLPMIKPSNSFHLDRKKLSKRQRYHESGYSSYTKWGA